MVGWKNKIPQNNSSKIIVLQFAAIMFISLFFQAKFLLSLNHHPENPPEKLQPKQQQTKQNKNHKNKPVTICDTWKISPLSCKFKSSAAMKPIYLFILLLFWTVSTTTDCPGQLDQTQATAWCSHAVDQQNPIVLGLFEIIFTFIFL